MNAYLDHALKYQRRYLPLLIIIVLLVPILSAVFQGVPLSKGGESYYHLSQARTWHWSTFYYLPLWLLQHLLPERALLFIPPLLAFTSLFLFLRLASKLDLPLKPTFFFLVFFILSPTFIWMYTTFSAFSYFMLLLLSGFLLFIQPQKIFHYLSLLPFFLATFFDMFSTIILLLVLLGYMVLSHQKKHSSLPYVLLPVSLAVNSFIFHQPFILGPFQVQERLPNLVADFGGMAGLSFFILLLAIIGLLVRWRKFLAVAALLLFFIPAYLYSTQVIGFLSLPITFFAVAGFMVLLERTWSLENLKGFTLLLLALGLLFSTVSYLDRISLSNPTAGDLQALGWIKNNIPEGAVVFSDVDNGYFIQYFAQRQPFYVPHQTGSSDDQEAIVNSIYIDQLFPLLERNNIKYFYFNPRMRERLPSDYGLLFLLKNERFKLLYSQEGYEVWEFK